MQIPDCRHALCFPSACASQTSILPHARCPLQQTDRSRSGNPAASYGPESFWSAFHHMMLDVGFVARGPERAAFWMAIWLAFFNQVSTTSIDPTRLLVVCMESVMSGTAH